MPKHRTARKKYGVRSALWDLMWICLTGGLWVIYIFIRETRKK